MGDERDLIRVRTDYRKNPPEDVYMYRLTTPIENGNRVFLDYLKIINELRGRPKFHNTLTANCTNVIWIHSRVNPGHLSCSWKILLSGYLPEYIYEQEGMPTNLSLPELQRRSQANKMALQADQGPDFSQHIRASLPLPSTR